MNQSGWMNQLHVSSMELVSKGWSCDQKYRVRTTDGRDCLLRLSDAAEYEAKKKEYEIIQRFAALVFPMSQPLDFGLCEDGVYVLLSWVEGEDLETVLPTLPEPEQYRLGCEAGRILKHIHSIPMDPADQPTTTKREKKLWQLSRYEQSHVRIEGDEAAIQYVKDNIGLIWRMPPVYQHGDFHPGNLIYRPDGTIGVIDFNRWEVGEPYEEFYKLQSFGREISIPYCVGQVDAYFEGTIPEDFWRTLAVYVAHASLYSIKWAEKFGASEIEGMKRRCCEAMEDYDGCRAIVPRWYAEYKISSVSSYEKENPAKTADSSSLVSVVIDRPLGSVHPKHPDIVYPVNYGFVPGVFAPDGEEQDVYVLGVDQPLSTFTGRKIAVIHRADDVEDKWVLAPEGKRFTAEEIMEAVRFQEQYFQSEVELCE